MDLMEAEKQYHLESLVNTDPTTVEILTYHQNIARWLNEFLNITIPEFKKDAQQTLNPDKPKIEPTSYMSHDSGTQSATN